MENSKVAATHEIDDAFDNPQPENNASENVSHPETDRSITRGFQNLGRLVYDLVTVKVKLAATKVKTAALQVQDSVLSAAKVLKEKGLIEAAKDLKDWISEHPWETALIVAPLVATACTAITLLLIGFGPHGIAAGSAAAAIQAGIGNVVAQSLFATCTSAMMGGYGAPIIFGCTWALTTAAIAAAGKLWRWWNGPNERRLVRIQARPSTTVLGSLSRATDTLILNSAIVVALVVYYARSRIQARRQRPEDERPLF